MHIPHLTRCTRKHLSHIPQGNLKAIALHMQSVVQMICVSLAIIRTTPLEGASAPNLSPSCCPCEAWHYLGRLQFQVCSTTLAESVSSHCVQKWNKKWSQLQSFGLPYRYLVGWAGGGGTPYYYYYGIETTEESWWPKPIAGRKKGVRYHSVNPAE